jgi:hypothetical protein
VDGDVGSGAAPSGMNGRYRAALVIDEQDGYAISGSHTDGEADFIGDERIAVLPAIFHAMRVPDTIRVDLMESDIGLGIRPASPKGVRLPAEPLEGLTAQKAVFAEQK